MPSHGRRGGSGRNFHHHHLTLHNNGGPLPPVHAQGGGGGERRGRGQHRQQQQSEQQSQQAPLSTSPVHLSQGNTANTSPEFPSPNVPASHNSTGIQGGDTLGYLAGGGGRTTGEHPTIIQRARPYLTEEQVQDMKLDDPGWEARDVSMRLNACSWILSVGSVLQFPIRTMETAMMLFHRFKIFHPKWDHPYADVAAAALFVACKIEDTLKKSREILAAGHSIKHGGNNAEPINPDSPLLDEAARRTLILERMILETSSFDFRNRHSQPFLVKFSKKLGLSKDIGRLAWDICIDCYRTLAPLKNAPHVQALAAICLAQKLLASEDQVELDYGEFEAPKNDVLDVVNDLLDLYTHHRVYTTVGERYSPEIFINIRIVFNKAAASDPNLSPKANGTNNSKTNGRAKGKGVTALAPGVTGLSEKDKMAIGESVRFMLDGERERRERKERTVEE